MRTNGQWLKLISTTSVPFHPDCPQLPPACYLHSSTEFADNRARVDRRVSLQPRGPFAHTSSRSSPASNLGEGGTGDGGRRLFLFRSRSNQESARPLRSACSSGRNPPIPRSYAKTGSGHGESAARGRSLPERTSRRLSSPGAAFGTHCRAVHVRFFAGRG